MTAVDEAAFEEMPAEVQEKGGLFVSPESFHQLHCLVSPLFPFPALSRGLLYRLSLEEKNAEEVNEIESTTPADLPELLRGLVAYFWERAEGLSDSFW